MSYNLAFQIVFNSRDGVITSTDPIDANPAFGDCTVPKLAIEAALTEVFVSICGVSQNSQNYTLWPYK